MRDQYFHPGNYRVPSNVNLHALSGKKDWGSQLAVELSYGNQKFEAYSEGPIKDEYPIRFRTVSFMFSVLF